MTTSDILTLAPASSYLAANAIAKGQLFPRNKLNPILSQQIYAVYFILNKINTLDPTNPALYPCAQYLWELMGRYGVAAQGITGNGGSVPSPTTPTQNIFPFYITSADFESDGVSYNNPNIVGVNLELFPNQLNQQFWYAGQGFFVYTSTGIQITYAGFDANTQDWTIRIDQIFSSGGGSAPATDSELLINTTDSLLINTTDSLLITA